MTAKRALLTGSGLAARGKLPTPNTDDVERVARNAAAAASAISMPSAEPEAPAKGQDPVEPRVSGLMEQLANQPPLNIAVGLLDPSPYQPRLLFDEESLQNLANTLLTSGQLQPIAVRRKADGRYEIIAGERRWRAAMLAGLPYVLAVVLTKDDDESAAAAVSENVSRENLSAYEFGRACHALLEARHSGGSEPLFRSVSALARKIGVSRSKLDKCLDFMKLPAEVRSILDVHPDLFGANLAEQMALLLDKVRTEDLVNVVESIRDRNVSEQYAASHLKVLAAGKPSKAGVVSRIPWGGTTASIKARISGRRIVLTCDPGISPDDVLERVALSAAAVAAPDGVTP